MFHSLKPVENGDFSALLPVLTELQGLKVHVLDGAASSTKINLADIRQEDTLAAVIEFTAGVPYDRKAVTTIVDTRASGTLTLANVVANDTAVVGGVTYTFKATPNPALNEVALGSSDTTRAAALAAKIMQRQGNTLTATSAAAVVTIKSNAEGTGGNSVTIVGGARITASGATLAGGTTTGGLLIADDTSGNKVIVAYFDKK